MQLHPLTLKFTADSESLETEFLHQYFEKSLPQLRLSLSAGIFFYAVFSVLDAFVVPEMKSEFWFIRFGIVCPSILAVLLLSYSSVYIRFFQLSLAALVVVGSLGIIAMIVLAPDRVGFSYYAGIILIFMFGYTLIRARFITAMSAGFITMVLYEIAAVWLCDTPLSILVQNNFFFISANFIGLFACYIMEYHERRDFFLTRRLTEEQEKVVASNRLLEQRVLERTAALTQINQELEAEMAERRLAEEALRKSEERHRNILERIEEGYFEVDLAGNLTYLNDAMCRIIGYERSESLGMNNRAYSSPEASKRMFLEFNRVFQTGNPVKNAHFEIIPKAGEPRHVEMSVSLIRDADLTPVGFRGIIRDITDKITAEKEKKELEEQLGRMQKMESLGLLAGGVAHDLNNVLTGAVSYPEILLMSLPENSPLKGPLEKIQASGRKAAAIVEDLLALARRGVVKMEPLNLNRIVTDYLKSGEHAKLKADHGGIHFRTCLANDLLNSKGSPVHLSKLLMNLVINAAEAQPGGGEILITTENRYIDSLFAGYQHIEEGNYAVLCVRDKGSGIAPEDRERIFEPFYTKKIMGRSGTGLGMSVVWGTIQDHKGYINIDSVVGQGTVFELFFPVTWDEVGKETILAPITDCMGNGEIIAVVDDVPEQREILTAMLAKLNYRSTAFGSGEEVVAFLQNHKADLLILDMIMEPGMDGLDTYRRILEIRPDQKAVIVSGYSETQRIKETLRIGARAYIKKPYQIQHLGMALKNALEKEI
ncbi:MAG: PAS domain S-box protein [Thermodesulfobacteriota bacterium]